MRLGRRLVWLGTLGGGVYWLMRYLRPRHSTLVLNEKVVVITGASAGIGRALAFAFAKRGARVVLVARNAERLEAVRREIEPYTSDSLVIPADITDDAQMQLVVSRTLETFGRIDVLVNNAGVVLSGRLQNIDAAQMENLLRVNLWAVMRLTQLVLPYMLAQRHGYILNVGSVMGRTANPLYTPYVATKYALSGFSDALRRELEGTGVRVTLVLPAWTRTDMVSTEMEELLERYGFRIDHPDYVAERALLGLVHGDNEVVFGGVVERLGIWAERYVPFVLRLYWRLLLTPEWIAVMEQAKHTR
jgi:short-subunit dehydrogenase